MKKNVLKDTLITLIILLSAFFISVTFQKFFGVQEHISTLFAFAVFLISLLTNSYFYGVSSAIISTLAINYAFTFPYFAFNFTIPVNLISAVVMVTIALLTGTLTTKIKHQESVKAENEKERMRGNLLRAVSHDIRTPLTSIYSSVSTLLENSEGLNDEQKKYMLESVKEDSEWLIRIVENLLSVTRIDSGRVKLVKTPTPIDELVDAVLIKFKKRYPDRDIAAFVPEELLFVPMDALLIEQVLTNILENSVIHGKELTKMVFKISRDGNNALFEIEDDGGGIPKERLSKLFEGVLGNSTLADGKKKNAGIGLSVCATIIKAHGGTIGAYNTKEGAVFYFTLSMEETNNEQQI